MPFYNTDHFLKVLKLADVMCKRKFLPWNIYLTDMTRGPENTSKMKIETFNFTTPKRSLILQTPTHW